MTSAIDIERRLRERYRQPGGVEQFGIEPVPEERARPPAGSTSSASCSTS
jgi:hypothetical protein